MSEKPMKLQRPYLDEEARGNLREFVESTDRDPPPVFAGRTEIIDRVTKSVGRCRLNTTDTACFTHAIHGAPGAGKTSLLTEISHRLGSENGSSEALTVVNLQGDEISRPDFVASEFIKAHSGSYPDVLKMKTTSTTTKVGAYGSGVEHQRSGAESTIVQQIDAGSSVWRAIRENTTIAEHHVFLLLVDESQNIEGVNPDKNSRNHVVTNLHAGFGTTNNLKIVPVFAGLSDTVSVLAERGVSRLPEGGSIRLGSLSQDDTEELVKRWMHHKAFGFENLFQDADIQRLSKLIAVASEGWPRHVTTYLREFGVAILDVGLTEDLKVDLDAVIERGHNSRLEYYEARLNAADLDRYEEVICQAARASSEGIIKDHQLDSIAKNNFEIPQTKSVELRKKAIKAGILERDRKSGRNSFRFPIPSFHTYMRCDGNEREFKAKMRQQMDAHSHLWAESKGPNR